ncbi:GvpL/GvpF family gas vesicle protein [Acidobacteria bacterium AH-259-O06]|nr:GvpL/GvpF family gas vesicle protein [Acidobacteria bacterium AH-259-O06]
MSTGRYLYCIVSGAHKIKFGSIGIDDSHVYSISHNDLSVIVHDCDAKAYDSKDEEVVGKWVLNHEKVTELTMDKFGTVLPFRFNTIIEAEDEQEVDKHVLNWLTEDQETIKEKLEKIRGKAEYGVQISWDAQAVSNKIIKQDKGFQSLEEEIENMPEGLAYMNRQKLENLLKKRLEKEADIYFKQFYSAIKGCVDDVKIEKARKEPAPRQMIMNLSCLASDGAKALAEELEKIGKLEGFFVRFTGPWPAYSFVEG